VCPEARQARLRSSAARRSKSPRKHNATAQAVEGNLGGFCVWPDKRTKRPQRGLRAEAARDGTPAGWGPWGQGWPAEVLALRYELGGLFAAISLRLVGRALRLRLRGITDGLSQHLAKLGLGLRRFPRIGLCPCNHK